MPGIFGGTACSQTVYSDLRESYERAWGTIEYCSVTDVALGGHAFGGKSAVHRVAGDSLYAVDGDPKSYFYISELAGRTDDRKLFATDGLLSLPPAVTANVVTVDPESRVLQMGADWAGVFPLYYTRSGEGLLFASLLRPLARAVKGDRDPFGLLQYLQRGHIYGNRTPFKDIYRLRPGEVVRFDPETGTLTRHDRSELWVGEPVDEGEDIPRACLDHLERSLEASLNRVESAAVMLSGGWDSRTILAGIDALSHRRPLQARIRGFSHGDTESRELALASRLCNTVGVPYTARSIGPETLQPEAIARDFRRTGVAVFPQWHGSARSLAADGCRCAVAGIYSEALGGHYGQTSIAGTIEKIASMVIREPLGRHRRDLTSVGDPVHEAMSALKVSDSASGGAWYLDSDFEASLSDQSCRKNAEIESSLRRLQRRGIERPDRLIEAFVSQHRVSQYIAAQTTSARTAVDICVPLADRRFMHFASRIPLAEKLNNSLNRGILLELESPLVHLPMASTLLPASAPIPLQEMSRGVRKLWELARWKGYFTTNGRLGPPRLSWVNFEFLRGTEVLHRLVEDLRLDIWERSALRRRIDELGAMKRKERMHPYFDQLGKIFTVDLLLR